MIRAILLQSNSAYIEQEKQKYVQGDRAVDIKDIKEGQPGGCEVQGET